MGTVIAKRLDLTNNRIGCLNADIFRGLTNLVRLNLSGNLFSSLSQGTFDYLGSLRSLEFQTEYLLCDCNILWMHRWVKERNITVRDTRCVYPKSLQAQPVTGVKQELLTCDPPLELPSFYMTPSHRQVVFEGDSLPFQCMASYIDQDMQVLWYQDGRIVETDESQGIFVEKNMIHNCSLIASALTISNIQAGSTGNWGCHVQTKRGNNTRTVDIVVLESSAQYCPPERVVNNKGDFRWPRTLAGITAYLQCTRNAHGSGSTLGTHRMRERPGADVIEVAFGRMMIIPAASMRTMSLEFFICLIRCPQSYQRCGYSPTVISLHCGSSQLFGQDGCYICG